MSNDIIPSPPQCDHCGQTEKDSGNAVLQNIGQYGTENICAECVKTYDPYLGGVPGE